MRQFSCQLGLIALGLCRLLAAEPAVDASQLPRVPPTPPEQALGTFKIKPGFRLELVAAEPLVVDPIAMSFDEEGRLYVVEMRDYSERRPERLGRIRRLEDLDGDGRFEKSTVFAEGLPWPTAVTCWAGGVFVGATPDILWMKDTNGDGVADEREVIFTGFASDYAPFETNKLNVQALMNSFQWSLDNRIQGATSFSGGKVKLVDTPFVREWLKRANLNTEHGIRNTPPLDLRGRDFSFDPRTLEMRAESGGGQHGMTFDNQGRKFVCSNSDHIQQIVYEDRYAARNPYYTMPSPRVSIAADGPAAEVFRISPDEPWRVLRTQWRVAGLVSGPVEGGGRASGYFTGATGLTIYRGDAYGEDFVGDAFIGDAGGNLVHRKKLRPDGILLRAERPADEQKVEFLASTDNWFRPVQFANAPDGCLYIADMYREVIEHPWSLPANLKKHLDLNSGNDLGRIYRIAPEEFKLPPILHLRTNSTESLVKLLEHRNGWHRDTAARLLVERQDEDAIPFLTALLKKDRTNIARIHAFYVLASLNALREEHLFVNFGVPMVYPFNELDTHELKLAERFLDNPSPRLLGAFNAVASFAGAPLIDGTYLLDPGVELQAALTVGLLRSKEKTLLLESILHRRAMSESTSAADRLWLYSAVLGSAGEDVFPLFTELRDRHGQSWTKSMVEPFTLLAREIGARAKTNEISIVLDYATQCLQIPPAGRSGTSLLMGLELAASVDEGLRRSGRSLRELHLTNDLLSVIYWSKAFSTVTRLSEGWHRPAIRLLALSPYSEVRTNLLHLVSTNEPATAVRRLAFATLTRFADSETVPELLSHWRQLASEPRDEATEFLMKRPERIRALLTAVEKGTVQAAELSVAQQSRLRSHRDASIREQAVKVLGRAATSERQSVVEAFQPALSLKGDAMNGQKTFQARCATCHKFGSEGHTLGPDLATVKSGGKEKLLVAILDPNREVAPNFLGYSVETKDGESMSGVLASEGANSVTLRMAGGAESVIARANIASLQSQGRSLMPEGLEEGLKPQDMADLLEFIVSGP